MWPAVLRHYQLGRNSVLTCIMLLFWFLRCCSRKSTHWGFRSFWFSLLVSALNWLGLKMFCRPLMCLISSKVGKCPASDWWVFGTCSDLLLCWDGEGSYTGIGSSFPCATGLLLASHWLFALKFIKRREGEKQQKEQTWSISVDSVLRMKFKISEQTGLHFLLPFFSLPCCPAWSPVFSEIFIWSQNPADQVS